MDDTAVGYASTLLPSTYIQQSSDALKIRHNFITVLFQHKKCPEKGWDNATIELLLSDLSLRDSNNFSFNCGLGEREARIFSDIVARRHFGFGHGIGRSGDLAEVQPKAAGSSILYKLTNALVLDIIRASGILKAESCLVVPMATGMTISLCMLTLKQMRPEAKYVLWPRIDQKSCFKSIITAGFEPVVIENVLEHDELHTDLVALQQAVDSYGAQNILAILTTTSCFAPRGIDHLEEVATLCLKEGIPHLINNAYGVQSSKCMHHIQEAARIGRVDAFVQSTDKNFMVPVGGSVVVGFDETFVEKMSKCYPGRASGSPILDIFITLLAMGKDKYKELRRERKVLKGYLEEKMRAVAEKHGLRVLSTKNNPISVAMTLPWQFGEDLTELGSMLFTRGVSGTRVVVPNETKTIAGRTFTGWK